MKGFLNRIIHGNCREVLTQLPDDCVDLIVTSPPDADQRKDVYGGVHPDRYVEWFMPIAAELKRVLKSTGACVRLDRRYTGIEVVEYLLFLHSQASDETIFGNA